MINISLRNINKYYKDKIILDNINLDIESSNIYMILGKSGAGKSTLLNIIGPVSYTHLTLPTTPYV